jgi:hypothetical protein
VLKPSQNATAALYEVLEMPQWTATRLVAPLRFEIPRAPTSLAEPESSLRVGKRLHVARSGE